MQTLGRSRGGSRMPEVELFDETAGYEDESGVQLAPGLTAEETRQAVVLFRLFNELWGVCLVVGDPGAGKDLFGNVISYKIKKYFPWKRVLRDEKPRKLYGPYAGLFNENVLSEELDRMRAVATGASALLKGDVIERAADDWVTGKGQVLLKNSVLYLTEYWRYCYNRDPMNPMNKTMGGIHKEKRHLDALIIGTGQLASELDKKTCLPWIDWRVTCSRSVSNPTGFTYFVEKVKYDRRADILVPLSRNPFPMSFDAGKPRSYMGDGRVVIRRPEYRPESEEERIILDVIKSGVDIYEDIVDLLEEHGDMSENEVLWTLKSLALKLPGKRYKRIIGYPCFFFLYNSKSAPQMQTTLRRQED